MIEKWRGEVKKCIKNIVFYPQKSKKYYQLINWKSYQNLRSDRIRKSAIPQPPDRKFATKCPQGVRIDKDSIDKDSIDKDSIDKEKLTDFKSLKRPLIEKLKAKNND